jgi:hypothetical protein
MYCLRPGRHASCGRAGSSGAGAWASGGDHSRPCGRGSGRRCLRSIRRVHPLALHTHPPLAEQGPACLDPPDWTAGRPRSRARGRARGRARSRFGVRDHGPSRIGVHNRLRGGVRIRSCSRACPWVSRRVGDPDRRFALRQRDHHLPRRPAHRRDLGANGRTGRRACSRPRSRPQVRAHIRVRSRSRVRAWRRVADLARGCRGSPSEADRTRARLPGERPGALPGPPG